MSEIQRYMYARDGMVPDAEHLRGSGEPEFWVRFTDHEAERAENLATIDFLNKELRSAVDALADAEARIEGLVHKEQGFDNADMEYGYGRGLAESIRALAALTQPQAEGCEIAEYESGSCSRCGRALWIEDTDLGPIRRCCLSDGGGAATAAGVADADLEGIEVHINGSSDLSPEEAEILGDAMKRAYVLMKERQGTTAIKPTPYAKAFRERVCPVPEFPSIRETAHEAIIEGGCCIQCGLPNNSETVLFHSCQAGAPADPTCPNTGHKFSHCDCDLGIEKEES